MINQLKKKTIVLILMVCLMLTACAKSEAAQAFDDLVSALPQLEVSTFKEQATLDGILNAFSAYDELTDKDKKQVENYDTLKTYATEYIDMCDKASNEAGQYWALYKNAIQDITFIKENIGATRVGYGWYGKWGPIDTGFIKEIRTGLDGADKIEIVYSDLKTVESMVPDHKQTLDLFCEMLEEVNNAKNDTTAIQYANAAHQSAALIETAFQKVIDACDLYKKNMTNRIDAVAKAMGE